MPLRVFSGVIEQVLVAEARERVVSINRVVPKLLNVRVPLVRNTLSIAIDIDSGEGWRDDRIFGKFVDLVERLVVGDECGGGRVVGIVERDLPKLQAVQVF